MRTLIIAPYGGKLSVLYIFGDNLFEAERQRAIAYRSWDLS